jgi:hypothetical protein
MRCSGPTVKSCAINHEIDSPGMSYRRRIGIPDSTMALYFLGEVGFSQVKWATVSKRLPLTYRSLRPCDESS